MAPKAVDSILEVIGNTPLVKLQKLAPKGGADIFVKAEYLNPSGSYKDRIAVEMIRTAEKEGKLKPGYTIVEASTGNTGQPSASSAHASATMSRYTCPRA